MNTEEKTIDLTKFEAEKLESLKQEIEFEIKKRSKGKVIELESRTNNYVCKPYAAIVDSNKKIISFLNPVSTEFENNYTIKNFEINNSYIGKTIVLCQSSSRTKRKEYVTFKASDFI